MATRTYAILGATGHIGTVLCEALLKKGHHIHAIGRDKNKLQVLKNKKADIFPITSFEDASALAKAFAGCDALFALIPPSLQAEDYGQYQDKVGEATIKALTEAKISTILNLSSMGAELAEGTGVIKGLHRQERRLNAIPNLKVLHLRPSYFMENFHFFLPLIKNMGILGSPMKADLPIPMVATRDIGLKAAELLDMLNFTGHTVYEFSGPKMVTMEEATKAIGNAIGKPQLRYQQFSYEDAEKNIIQAGMKPKLANLLVEMYKGFNEGKITVTQNLTGEHLGRTTIDEFAKSVLAQEFLAGAMR